MHSTPKLDIEKNPWMKDAGLLSILNAISNAGGEARFVGGAVRDALLGRDVGDVDLAVNLSPDKVTEALNVVGIKAVPTGIDHGTITAVADHKGYELTTLRHDVETDGRRAKVAFTDDWQADASRRDFTFNAIYADADGKLYDYFGGIEDLLAGRVRFIGKAESRIREDILRILRFFRFLAWYGKGTADSDALRACERLSPLLPQLSVERVWKEIGKLLLAPNAAMACRLMVENDILQQILPDAFYIDQFEKLIDLEKLYGASDSVRRLASLFSSDDLSALQKVARNLHMSKRETEKLKTMTILSLKIDDDIDRLTLRHMLYQYGVENVRDALLLAKTYGAGFSLDVAFKTTNEWESPVFPIGGKDIIKFGVKSSPRLGNILSSVEDWWKKNDFQPNRDECLVEAKRQIFGK